MNTTRIGAAVMAAASAAVLALAGPASADTIASETPPVVLAQDTTPAPATIPADVVGIDANVVGGLAVTGHQGKTVTAAAKGRPTKTVTVAAGKPATLKGLVPGVRYTVSIGGRKIAVAVPLAQVGAASALNVQTTATPGTVQVSWDHTIAPNEGKAVTYDVTATPLNADGTDGAAVISTTSSTTSATLTGLDTKVRYRFAVTPRNTASTGRVSSATMSRNLAEITSSSPKRSEPAAVAPQAPAPAPASAPAPSTKTIYVCPGTFTDNGKGLCEKTLPYTFTTKAYTYHDVATGPAPILDQIEVTAPGCPAGYKYEDYNWIKYCRLYGPVPTIQVKDNPPTGYTDDGNQWITKDAAPAGYTDNGTAWVATAAKVAEIVPA